MPIYNTSLYKNNTIIALNGAKTFSATKCEHDTKAMKMFKITQQYTIEQTWDRRLKKKYINDWHIIRNKKRKIAQYTAGVV